MNPFNFDWFDWDDVVDFFIWGGDWTLKTFLLVLMALLYIGAGINHFVHPDFYIKIMPSYIPAHELMVQLSGIAEILLGIGLLIPATRKLSAWGIIAMLLVFMVVHVDMLVHAERFEGVPFWGLVLRIPLQFLLIAWAWWYRRDEEA